jgi:anti-sigma-K factor RskA
LIVLWLIFHKENKYMSEPMVASPVQPTPCHAGRWRAATVVLLLLLVIGFTSAWSLFEQFKAQLSHVQTQLQGTSQIKYVSVLLDAQQAPAMLITVDTHEGALQLQRLNSVKEGREDTMQLWAIGKSGSAPRSLGIVESAGKTLRLAASEEALKDVTQLAISVENKGGVPQTQGPRLPYLFQGALVQKAL